MENERVPSHEREGALFYSFSRAQSVARCFTTLLASRMFEVMPDVWIWDIVLSCFSIFFSFFLFSSLAKSIRKLCNNSQTCESNLTSSSNLTRKKLLLARYSVDGGSLLDCWGKCRNKLDIRVVQRSNYFIDDFDKRKRNNVCVLFVNLCQTMKLLNSECHVGKFLQIVFASRKHCYFLPATLSIILKLINHFQVAKHPRRKSLPLSHLLDRTLTLSLPFLLIFIHLLNNIKK